MLLKKLWKDRKEKLTRTNGKRKLQMSNWWHQLLCFLNSLQSSVPNRLQTSIELFSWSWFKEASDRQLEYFMKISTISEKEKGQEWRYWVKQLQCAKNLHQSQNICVQFVSIATITERYLILRCQWIMNGWWHDLSSWRHHRTRHPSREQDAIPDRLPAEEGGVRTSGMSCRVKIYDDINSSITFYCTGSNDFLVAFKKLLKTDHTFPIKETVNESHVWQRF